MTIIDMDKKMEIIDDFYNQSTEIVHMVYDSIHGFHYVNGYNLLEEYDNEREKKDIEIYGYSKREEIENRRKQLIIELGRAGEYAIKYILLLKQMKDYPNQTIDEFKQKTIYSIGERGVGNTYINQYHVNPETVDSIKNEKQNHRLQPLHDYSYLFFILKSLYPVLSDNAYKSFQMDIMSQHIQSSDIEDNIKKVMICFPQCNWMKSNLFDIDMGLYVREYDQIRNESGDSFVRLRYVENNENNKQYDLASVLYYLSYLSFHIELVHQSNNDIEGNIELEYSKNKLKKLADSYILSKLKREHPEKKTIFKGQFLKEFEEEYKRMNKAFSIFEKNYNSIIQSLNYSQLKLYEQLSGTECETNEIYNNLISNIIIFEKYPQIYEKLPLLLDSENNFKVFNILVSNGLDINKLDNFDPTIFCIPAETIKRFNEYISYIGENLVKDNRVNDKLIKFVEAERIIESRKVGDMIPPLPLRRL